jgi:hypothetical protein
MDEHGEMLGRRQLRQERDLAASRQALRRGDSGVIFNREVLDGHKLEQPCALDAGKLRQRVTFGLGDVLYRDLADFQARFEGAAYAAASVCFG